MAWRQDGDAAPASTDRSERPLVRRMLAGDARAFLDLVNRHHASAVRVAAAWGHEGEDAERVARSAWRTLLDHLAEHESDLPLRTSLLRTASALARAGAPRCRPRSEPASTALRGAIAALPAWERVVITLRDVEGLGPDDAAAVLGVTALVQHRLLHRARTAVLRYLAAGGVAPGERRAATG